MRHDQVKHFKVMRLAFAMLLVLCLLMAIVLDLPDDPATIGRWGVAVFSGGFGFTLCCFAISRLERGDA